MNENILYHTSGDSLDTFFSRVDKFGGWPLAANFVGFHHSDERECSFVKENISNGWFTVMYDKDDYYIWKLSIRAKENIRNHAIKGFINRIQYSYNLDESWRHTESTRNYTQFQSQIK